MNSKVAICLVGVLLVSILSVESLFNPGGKIKGQPRGFPTRGGGGGKPFKTSIFGTPNADRFKYQKRFKSDQKESPFRQFSKFGFAASGRGRGGGKGRGRGTGGRGWGERLKNAADIAQELKKLIEEKCVKKQIKLTQAVLGGLKTKAKNMGQTLQTYMRQNAPAIAKQAQGGSQIFSMINNNVSAEKAKEMLQLAYDLMTKCLISEYATSAVKEAVKSKLTKSKEEKPEDPLLD